MWFSFFSYKFSKEKFRLDLLDRRWEVYQETLKFCSMVMKFGDIPTHSDDEDRNKEAISGLISAHEAFRGMGYHKSKALFGDDISDCFDKLNEAYAWFVTYNDIPYSEYSAEDFERKRQHISLIVDISTDLPDLFKPYVYFGDYKR